ncbi:MAG: uroporphyrinogen-III C-methyltransferase [Planctomycetota bacterium]|jgi:uroporphyrinogen III methyltransferase/synthase
MPQGKVYLVGSGPGDAELVTVKGRRVMSQADVIFYDHLIASELLRLAGPSAELISVGKFAGSHTVPQKQINALLISKAKEGKTVVRLKGGDPYLFGRGGEEAQACADGQIEFEVVPGITSALAAACYAGIPPSHRDYTSSVAIVTGHRKEEKELQIPKAGTVIFLMGLANIKKIVESLLKAGWAEKTKIAAIEHGTCYDQRVVTGTLEEFTDIVEKANLRTPVIFIVGRVVELREKLDWFGKRPNVLVLGSHPYKYQYMGNIVHRRVIDCVPIDYYSQVDSVLKDVGKFDWIVFTSVNGAKYFFERLFATGKDARALANVRIAVIGKTTAERLKEFGITADMVPENESSAGLLEEFSRVEMKNKKILLPRAEVSTEQLPQGLMNMQAEIEKVPVYKIIDLDPGPIDFDYIDKIVFTSGSTVRAFVKRYGSVPSNIRVYCLGRPSLNVAKEYNIEAEVLA